MDDGFLICYRAAEISEILGWSTLRKTELGTILKMSGTERIYLFTYWNKTTHQTYQKGKSYPKSYFSVILKQAKIKNSFMKYSLAKFIILIIALSPVLATITTGFKDSHRKLYDDGTDLVSKGPCWARGSCSQQPCYVPPQDLQELQPDSTKPVQNQ